MRNSTNNCWQTFEVALSTLDRVLLYGAPGVGKTHTALTHEVGDGGSFRLICTPDMTTFDIAGGFMPSRDGGFDYIEGAALKAWRGNGVVGGRLVVDEIDRAGGDALSQLLAFLDSEQSASFIHPVTGEMVRPLPGFSVVLTTNLENPDDLDPALRDRFPVAVRIDEAHPGALAQLPENLRPLAESLIGTQARMSIRSIHAFAQLRLAVSDEAAANMVFGESVAQSVLDAIAINSVGQ